MWKDKEFLEWRGNCKYNYKNLSLFPHLLFQKEICFVDTSNIKGFTSIACGPDPTLKFHCCEFALGITIVIILCCKLKELQLALGSCWTGSVDTWVRIAQEPASPPRHTDQGKPDPKTDLTEQLCCLTQTNKQKKTTTKQTQTTNTPTPVEPFPVVSDTGAYIRVLSGLMTK